VGASLKEVSLNDPAIVPKHSDCAARLVDVDRLAAYLGVKKTWIYDRTGTSAPNRIPHFKIGKYIRFDIQSEEFKMWLQRNFRI